MSKGNRVDILSSEGREQLDKLARTRLLLAFDFDGTLAPLVDPLDHVQLVPGTRELLDAVSRRYPCVIITGRGREDMLRRLTGLNFHAVIGNHGIERDATAEEHPVVSEWVSILERELAQLVNVRTERKRFSVTVHYGQSPTPDVARAAIRAAAGRLGAVRIVDGKGLVNIVPADNPHKGDALLKEMQQWECDHALFIGDDLTDEDAFAIADGRRIVGVRVGLPETTRATHYLRDQGEMDELLRLLLTFRPTAMTGPEKVK